MDAPKAQMFEEPMAAIKSRAFREDGLIGIFVGPHDKDPVTDPDEFTLVVTLAIEVADRDKKLFDDLLEIVRAHVERVCGGVPQKWTTFKLEQLKGKGN